MIFFDLESDGFLDETTTIHCLVVMENGVLHRYRKDDIEVGLNHILSADKAVAHNGIKFDIPVIKKLYPWFNIHEDHVLDTLIMSRLIYADLGEIDTKLIAKNKLPKELYKAHSLKAWGYRLGEHKGDPSCGFEEWSQELEDYCAQDVVVLEKLYQHLVSKEPSPESIELEHKVAWIIAEQERTGFMFDVKKAEDLHVELLTKKLTIEAELQKVFPPWFTPELKTKDQKKYVVTTTSKVNNSKTGVTKGVSYTKVTQNLFNPQSRQHISDRLIKMRGWKPEEFTPNGQPKVDETIISKLDYPEAKPLAEYLMLCKRIGQLAEGDQAWLKQVKNDGRIHGSVITNGAVTGRATHSNPNVAQVPSCVSPYGGECRRLFRVPPGKALVGADLSGLELRCLAHYMGQFDQGAYARVLLEGDVHTANQQAAGLETRAQAKTFIYGFLYGAGATKIGSIVGKGAKEGQILKDRFLSKTPALKRLVTGVQAFAEKNGYLPGLDKRKLTVRSSHAALNTLLQSAGALIAKQALIEFKWLLIGKGYQERAKLVAWVHDEIQVETDKEIADEVGRLAVRAFELAGEHFNFRCPITGEYKVGDNWESTH